MSTAMQFGDSTSRRVEATYSTPDVVDQRRIILAALGLRAGEQVLDIGSGPGFLTCEMAEIVGPSGSVTGLDSSDSMLTLARARAGARAAGPALIEFGPGEATALPYAGSSFDAVGPGYFFSLNRYLFIAAKEQAARVPTR